LSLVFHPLFSCDSFSEQASGTIAIEGKGVEIHNPVQAKSHGLAAVYQDVMLARHLSVGENFFLGKLPRSPLGLIDWQKVHQVAAATLRELDLSIDSRILVRHLSPAHQEMVTIAKAVYDESKLIVFDQPTALLWTGWCRPDRDPALRLRRRFFRQRRDPD
jgi:ribose transport system ATP-binding protein